MKFCSECATPLEFKIPPADNLPRHVCPHCGAIHYLNPKLIVGALVHDGAHVLMCKRAIEPRLGKWTFPAGFMEMHETSAEGALRETLEEAGARVTLEGLLSVTDVPQVSQTHLIYRATLLELIQPPCEETAEIRMMSESEIDCENIAFDSVALSLRQFFNDFRTGHFSVHVSHV